MARNEQDREDLLREATALTPRAELAVDGFSENVVVGFRAGGAASVFFGGQPVYQFNTDNELRRAYDDGLLFKAVGGRLFQLRRERTAGAVQLLRRQLDDEQTAAFLARCREQLDTLRRRLEEKQFQLIGQIPPDADVPAHIRAWLVELPREIAIAEKPNVA